MNAEASSTLTLEGLGVTPLFRNLVIDVRTKDSRKLRGALKRLRTVTEVSDGGAYREDPSYAQIHLTTALTEDELGRWLWSTNHGCDYVGVFQR